jgi:hypothetical protein
MNDLFENSKSGAMKIYSSSWFTDLPPTIQKIGISRGTPRGQKAGYRLMKELAPGDYFRTASPEEYHERFMAGLADLDPETILAKIKSLAAGRDVALLCYEKPTDPAAWCHRGQIAGWIWDQFGIKVYEFGLEDQGFGWQNPKLLPQFRR